MHRHLSVTCSAALAAAVLGIAACSHSQPKVLPSSSSAAALPTSTPLVATAPPTAPLPVPEALVDVLNRLVDPNIPAVNKVSLIEGATPETAPTLDKFINALRDNGHLPMTFVATNIAWSDKNPSNVVATVTVNTAKADNRAFTFPMEFAPLAGGWQLSRQTAEVLLALGHCRCHRHPNPSRHRPRHRPPRPPRRRPPRPRRRPSRPPPRRRRADVDRLARVRRAAG
jgi:hypothetical protein